MTVAVWALARGLETSRVRARAKRSLWIMGTSGTEVGGPAAGAGVFCGSMTMICILVTPSYGAVVKRLTPAAIR
ncbi:hypothetical protein ZRA01_17770 [Zoogloea ramigera]|uniref:Uncharacterized protein n=1 Tax=Zoogloea ramigera TaxID=350 RepID=A0A4Y4CW64_ZOORA|nr:hypothetical protein ZRA01_17770 [Zoogloea ramigera]